MADALDVTEIVRRAVQANAKFYKGWLDLSLEYVRGISEIFGETETAAPDAEGLENDAGVLVLEGEAGSAVRGAFLVTNDLGRNVSCEFVVSEFAEPDGASVRAKAAFEPATLELDPGAQQVVRVMIPVDDTLTPGVAYTGEVAIKGLDGFTVPVVLRRLHRIEDPPSQQDPADRPPAAGKPKVPRAAGSKAPRKTAGTRTRRAKKATRPTR